MTKATPTIAATTTKPPRTYASDLHLSLLGTMDLNVDAVPAKRSLARPKLVVIDPNIDEPTPLQQCYFNDDTGKRYNLGDMDRAREVDGVLHRVSEAEMEAIKAPTLPIGQGTVTPYNAADVRAVTQPGGTLYWLRPHMGKAKRIIDSQAKMYALFVDVLADTSKAWVTEVCLRASEQKMMELVAWQGRLLLRELVRPGEFNEVAPVEYEYDARLLAGVTEAADALCGKFDPTQFENFYRDRIQALDEAKRNGETVSVSAPAVEPDASSDDDGLLALLAASVKQAKAPAKKPARTRKVA